MKIAIVGCGALGSFYGAKLCAGGHQVHFLLRSDFETVARDGVFISSPEGNFHVRPKTARDPQEIGQCDLVIIGLKTTANNEFARLLPPLVGNDTVVLTLQNGLGNEEELATLFGAERILGGLCFVCLNRTAPGQIQHLAHGRVVMGEFQKTSQMRAHRIAEAMRASGINCVVTENLQQAHWEKLVWNIPFNGLGVAGSAGYEAVMSGVVDPSVPLQACLPTDVLLADRRWAGCVRELMIETIQTARAQNLDVALSAADQQIERTRLMGPYKASTLIDFERGQPLELESLFLRPLAAARKSGVQTPRLSNLCRVLSALDSRRRA